MPEGWEWDETLYRGSAPYYMQGRPPYAPGLADQLAEALALDGDGRLIDVGCGPGVVALPLAHLFTEGIGVDPDPGMLAEAQCRADAAGIVNLRWVQARAEDLPLEPGLFRVATFAQSFHWMDRPRVAATVFDMLEPGGAFVHLSDAKTPHPDVGCLPYPPPPYAAIQELVRNHLGPIRRAGAGTLPHGTPGDEAEVLAQAGFRAPERLRIPADAPFVRDSDDIIAWVYSLSSSTPHLFGDRRDAFAQELRVLLHEASPDDCFADPPLDTEIMIFRK